MNEKRWFWKRKFNETKKEESKKWISNVGHGKFIRKPQCEAKNIQTVAEQNHQYLWNKNKLLKKIEFEDDSPLVAEKDLYSNPPIESHTGTSGNPIVSSQPIRREGSPTPIKDGTGKYLMKSTPPRDKVIDPKDEDIVPNPRLSDYYQEKKSISMTNEKGNLLNFLGFRNQRSSSVDNFQKSTEVASQFGPFVSSSSSQEKSAVCSASGTVQAQVEEPEVFQTCIRNFPMNQRRCSQPSIAFPWQQRFAPPIRPKSGPPLRQKSKPSLRPRSGPPNRSRFSRVSSLNSDEGLMTSDYEELKPPMKAKPFYPPDVSPIYERARAAPTPISSRCSTPVWDMDSEKRVRFLQSEIFESSISRPSSAISTYSNILKNSTRFAFMPDETSEIYGILGHSPRICNCPCHFFPTLKQNVGIQVSSLDPELPRKVTQLSHPPTRKHYRLFVVPSFSGLGNLSFASKCTAVVIRGILSQIGLAVVLTIWWLIGALVFSTFEKPLHQGLVAKMSFSRRNLVIDLATELRLVKPYDSIWKEKIEDYMLRLETSVVQAVKAGYTSNAVSWSIPQALVYAVSLTSLLGPGGLIIQSPLTKMFSLIYPLIGIPILFLLLFNVAYTIKDGLMYVLRSKRRKGKIQSESPVSTPANRKLERDRFDPTYLRTIIEEESTLSQRSTSSRAQLIAVSTKVPVLDNGSRPGSAASSTVRVQNMSINSPGFDVRATSSGISAFTGSSIPIFPSGKSASTEPKEVFKLRIPKLECQHESSHLSKNGVPWFIFGLAPLFYLLFGTTLLVTTKSWTILSALVVIGNNLMFIDHGWIGQDQLFGQAVDCIIYALFIVLGSSSSLIFILGIWSKLKSSLAEAGTDLCVVKVMASPS